VSGNDPSLHDHDASVADVAAPMAREMWTSATTRVVHSFDRAVAMIELWTRRTFGRRRRDLRDRWRVAGANALIHVLQALSFRSVRGSGAHPDRIVVYTAGILGDNVVLLPAIRALRRRYPSARLAVMVNVQENDSSGARGLFRMTPWIDELRIVTDRVVVRRGIRVRFDEPALVGMECDLFVNLSPFGKRGWLGAVFRELLIARRLGAERAVGFRLHSWNRRDYAPSQMLDIPNEGRRAAEVLETLGLRVPLRDHGLALDSCGDIDRVLEFAGIREGEGFVVLHPGAALLIKQWPAERFGAVAAWIHSTSGHRALITGTAQESELCSRVAAAAAGSAVSIAGQTTVTGLAQLLARSALCVCNDTGTMHLAAALGTPLVAIFSTRVSPTWWYPNADRHAVVFRMLPCSGCRKDTVEGCGHECMLHISVEDVKRAVSRVEWAGPRRAQAVQVRR